MKNITKLKIIFLVLVITILTFIPSFVNLNASTSVMVGGENIGMELKGNGLIVSNTTTIHYEDIVYNPSKDSDIQIGDLIYQVNNKNIYSVSDLEEVVNDFSKDIVTTSIKIKRNGKDYDKSLKIFKVDNSFKTGLYVKEKLLGIGTLTFVDPKTMKYAALGHEVKDSDYNDLYPLLNGTLFESTVTGIKKSVNGTPGEKVAQINKNSVIGTIDKNTIYGIYGKYEGEVSNNLIETSDNVKKGLAYIRTVIDNNEIKEYEIEITSIKEQNTKSTKGFSYQVTDNELLSKTNGIIQGMSGSPIIQDGKLIGAVTHVIVDNCTCGHAIYIRWMIDELNDQ